MVTVRRSRSEVFCKKVFLEISQNLPENTCARVSFLIKFQALGLRPATLLKKNTLAQVFSCEFCEISKNNYFYRTPLVATSGLCVYLTSESGRKTHRTSL